jgi:hypothetical protein
MIQIIDERACVAYRLVFKRTLNEGETIKELEKIPRAANCWPCERDFAKWPIVDQQEWVNAAALDYLEEGLKAGGGEQAMSKAWLDLGEYMKHVGIDMKPQGKDDKASARDLLLAHYKWDKGYDCSQVATDFATQPDIVDRIRYFKKQQRVMAEARREQKRASKKRRGARRRAAAQAVPASERV